MKQYKITQCRVESLKPGDMVLSLCIDNWYSFIFKEKVDGGTLRVRFKGELSHIRTIYGYEPNNSLFYKVEKDFPFIWNEPIDKYNLNIGQ